MKPKIYRRNTRQKKIILEELKKVRLHPDAKTILRMVRRRIPAISFGTVYRNLGILCEEGSVLELNLDRYTCRYDADTSNHHHFFCVRCQKVFDLDGSLISGVGGRLKKIGFFLKYQQMHLYGYCPRCKKSQSF